MRCFQCICSKNVWLRKVALITVRVGEFGKVRADTGYLGLAREIDK